MQVTVPSPQATHLSYGLGLQAVAMPATAIVVAPQNEVGFKPDHRKTMKNLSALQIAVGILCVVIYAVLIAIRRWYKSYSGFYLDFTGAGIWCGVLYIIAGSLGVAAARQNRQCLIISAMVMSILSSLFLWVVLGMAAYAVNVSVRDENCMRYSYNGRNSYSYPCIFYDISGYKAADSILIILSVVEFIISLSSCVLCCKACCGNCCYSNNYGYQSQTMYYTQAHSAGQQVIFAPQAGVAGGHAYALMPTQSPYMGMQQQQPVLFTHPATSGATVAPPSYQSSVAGLPEYPANQVRDVATGNATYEQPLEVTKDRMAERY